jgi:hypothetical protein
VVGVNFDTWRGFWSFDLCLGVNALALVLNEKLRKLGCLEWWWLGVFIALNHQQVVGGGCCRWAHRTDRCASHVTQPLGFGSSRPLKALSSSGTGQSGVAPDRHCLVSSALWLCRVLLRTIALVGSRCSRPLHWIVVTALVHRTVRWIIAESARRNLGVAVWTLYGPGAPDSPVRQTRAHSVFLLLWIWSLTSIFYWFVLNLYAPVEYII